MGIIKKKEKEKENKIDISNGGYFFNKIRQ